jgi:hypothetical protein
MSIMGGFDALMVDASNLIIERNRINGTIAFCYHKAVANVVVSKNFVETLDNRWGDFNEIYSTGIIITNNIVTYDISFNGGATLTVTNNVVGNKILCYNSIVKNNIAYNINQFNDMGTLFEHNVVHGDPPSGTGNVGNLVWDDLFVTDESSTDGSYVLSESSAAKGAGEGNIDCGAFGGNDPYILSGYPPMPVIYNAEIPPTATESLLIKLEARSQK